MTAQGLDPASYSFAAVTRHWATHQPMHPAVTSGDTTLTYGELDALSSRMAQALRTAGVGHGDRVAYLGRNRVEYPAMLFATSKADGVSVALNWRLAAGELAGLLRDADPALVFAHEEFRPALGAALDMLAADGCALPSVVWLADDRGLHALEHWCDGAPSDDTGLVPAPDDLAMLTYTSGTTGRPKGVMVPNRAVGAHCAKAMPWVTDTATVSLIASPVFHAAGTGWVFLTTFFGGHAVLLPDAAPGLIVDAIARHHVTDALLVPALIQILLDHPSVAQGALASLRNVVYGASPIAEPILRRAMQAFADCDFTQGYGMSETVGPCTFLGPAEHRRGGPLLLSAGTAPPGVEMSVRDPHTGEPLPDGDVGEIWTRSDQNCIGYWNRSDATEELLVDGWLRTGDAGRIADGYLYVSDRIKDVIVSGGENVYAGEVENVLLDLPGIADACVIGVPDERWGETVKAVVVAQDGATVDEADVIAACRERLAHYKCPTSVDLTEALPRNPAGKVLRRSVREPYWADEARRVG